MDKDILFQSTVVELLQLLRARVVSAADVAQSFITRSQELESILHVWAAMDTDYILNQAYTIDSYSRNHIASSLHGIPVGVKDVFNTEFYPTQKGTPIWRNYHAGNDARCVTYLRREGAIIFGKTETAELAVHANGKSLNPHHLSHVTGSSSGGSAAAIAAAMIPAALGSQTGGSIIRPASWCGVYAMKPSFGLIPRTGVLKTTDTLDTMGFFTRGAEDLSILLNALRVSGENFPIQDQKIKNYTRTTPKKWRVAFCDHALMNDMHAYVDADLDRCKSDLSTLKQIELLNLKLPSSVENWRALHRRIYHPCLAYYLKMEREKAPHQLSKVLRDIFDDAQTILPEDYELALQEQVKIANSMEMFFRDHQIDVIIMSSSNGSAPYGCEPALHFDLNPLWTMAWLPVINVPQFKCPKKLPYGLQLIGPRYSDYRVLAFLSFLCKNQIVPECSKIAMSTTSGMTV